MKAKSACKILPVDATLAQTDCRLQIEVVQSVGTPMSLRVGGQRICLPLVSLLAILACTPSARAQAPVVPLADPPPVTPAERSWSGPAQKPKAEKTFWETVPPIQPFPRQGNFIIAPTGPGYYTLFDQLNGRRLEKRPKAPFLQWGQNANSSFNLDFRYLDDPKNKEFDGFDPLKRIHLGENWLFSTGGEVRDRYATIQNAALFNRKPQAGATDNFNLFRTRIYGDLWYRDEFRVFAEFITAHSSPQSIPFASTDVLRNDFLNLFAEVKLFTVDDHGAYARIGRQELLFGSQRALSPSDWANSRRAFQGVRGSWHSDEIEEDFFVVNPVIPDPVRISSIDRNQYLLGNWFKYRFTKDSSADLYYLLYDNHNPNAAKGQGGVGGGFSVNTFGSRFVGEYRRFLYDFEGAIQGGRWANQSIFAGIAVAGLGYHFKAVPTTPTLWAYYDFASGDPNPNGTGVHRTYSTLFPFGHSYFAGLDAIGRQNVHDFHLEFGVFPANWMRATLGYHAMTLANAKDALYSPSGAVVRQDRTGRAGTDIGNAVSAALQFHIDRHQIFFVGYSHLFAGDYIRNTAATAAAARDLSALWIQYSVKW